MGEYFTLTNYKTIDYYETFSILIMHELMLILLVNF